MPTIRGQNVLREVVRTETDEIRVRRKQIDRLECSGSLYHHTHRNPVPRLDHVERFVHLRQALPRPGKLICLGYKRNQQPQVSVRGFADGGPELVPEQVRKVEADTDGTPSQVRVILRRHRQEQRELVSSDVDGSQGYGKGI